MVMFAKMKIGTRIQMALGFLLLVVLALGFSTSFWLGRAHDSDILLYERGTRPLVSAGEYRVDFQNAWGSLMLAASAKSAAEAGPWLSKTDDRLAKAETNLTDAIGALKGEGLANQGLKQSGDAARAHDTALANLEQVSREFRSLLAGIRTVEEAIRRGEGESVLKNLLAGPLNQQRELLSKLHWGIRDSLTAALQTRLADNNESSHSSLLLTRIFMVVGALLAGLLGWILARYVGHAIGQVQKETDQVTSAVVQGQLTARAAPEQVHFEFSGILSGLNNALDTMLTPIDEANAVLEKLAKRDLVARVVGDYRGDLARLKESVNQTAASLQESLSQVASAVDQVSAAAGEIASSSQTVADGASAQASSLEETSSALESMSAMSKRTADNAAQANALAQTARNAAIGGAEAVTQMSSAMANIKTSAEGTSQIIKDINEIAFQTNLLALNAAVEAARAGEAGRGFAVVAEEVRSLALRSKEAAMKTEELIRESVRQAGEGESMSSEVSERLAEISQSIEKVTGIVNEISASAKEQSSGVDQINRAVADMNKVTQQNAANSEESSSAAAELSSQSEELAAMVSSFQLSGGGASHRTASPAKAKRPRMVAPVSAPVKPESVIPMDDDPAFQSF
jgi:methyl-accepting chemotaxis protein